MIRDNKNILGHYNTHFLSGATCIQDVLHPYNTILKNCTTKRILSILLRYNISLVLILFSLQVYLKIYKNTRRLMSIHRITQPSVMISCYLCFYYLISVTSICDRSIPISSPIDFNNSFA